MGEISCLENSWVTNPCGFESYHFRILFWKLAGMVPNEPGKLGHRLSWG
jgi:hypothetical protein